MRRRGREPRSIGWMRWGVLAAFPILFPPPVGDGCTQCSGGEQGGSREQARRAGYRRPIGGSTSGAARVARRVNDRVHDPDHRTGCRRARVFGVGPWLGWPPGPHRALVPLPAARVATALPLFSWLLGRRAGPASHPRRSLPHSLRWLTNSSQVVREGAPEAGRMLAGGNWRLLGAPLAYYASTTRCCGAPSARPPTRQTYPSQLGTIHHSIIERHSQSTEASRAGCRAVRKVTARQLRIAAEAQATWHSFPIRYYRSSYYVH